VSIVDRTGQVWRHIDSVMLVIGPPCRLADPGSQAARRGQTYLESANNAWDDSPHLTRLL
jgi:hypothetical protein